jgi:addiction module RelB/DinJ family antitoxin
MLTEQVSFRIDAESKAAAEAVLKKLGLSTTDAMRMFFKQITLHQGLPFEARVNLPTQTKTENFKAQAATSMKRNRKTYELLLNR